MFEYITLLVLGLGLIFIGILNRKGNIKMMHSYHYKRVSKNDIIPFGKKVGLGTIIIGSTLTINGILCAMFYYTENEMFEIIAKVLLIIGFAIGLIIIFRAMLKYNKGIF